jgi:protocatechuate 4,5-dioxygenase beta chain
MNRGAEMVWRTPRCARKNAAEIGRVVEAERVGNRDRQVALPSSSRCYRLGQVIGRAIASWPRDERVVVMSAGGLSHQLDGERAGFINKEFDLQFMDSMITNPAWAAKYLSTELVELSGTQGVALMNWLVARGSLPQKVRKQQASNTASGLMVLEGAA